MKTAQELIYSSSRHQSLHFISFLAGMHCKYLDRGARCYKGCTHDFIVCHLYAKGRCRQRGLSCNNGYHYKPTVTPLQRQKVRGNGFRPYVPDGAAETELKKHLATLMLSSRCEDLLDLDAEIIETLYRRLSLKRHPDKCNGQGSELFRQLQEAKEYVKRMLPFHEEA